MMNLASHIEKIRHNKDYDIDNIIELNERFFKFKLDDCNLMIYVYDDIIYCKSDKLDKMQLNKLNLKLIFDPDVNKIREYYNIVIKNDINIIKDHLKLFQNKEKQSKYLFDKIKLLENFNSTSIINKDIPKNLRLNHKQIFNMILKEVENINTNFNYNHYIKFHNDNPYELRFCLKYNNPSTPYEKELIDKLSKLNDKYNYDYIELAVSLDNSFYPYVPPKIMYIKPCISYDLMMNINNLSILKT
jgi:hypothetical protein